MSQFLSPVLTISIERSNLIAQYNQPVIVINSLAYTTV
jgi:hypothetical protein